MGNAAGGIHSGLPWSKRNRLKYDLKLVEELKSDTGSASTRSGCETDSVYSWTSSNTPVTVPYLMQEVNQADDGDLYRLNQADDGDLYRLPTNENSEEWHWHVSRSYDDLFHHVSNERVCTCLPISYNHSMQDSDGCHESCSNTAHMVSLS